MLCCSCIACQLWNEVLPVMSAGLVGAALPLGMTGIDSSLLAAMIHCSQNAATHAQHAQQEVGRT
jgi:hypothetical protein